MSSCIYMPYILNKKGEEKPSNLFKSLVKTFGRTKAITLWSVTRTKEFKSFVETSNINVDENGEITFDELKRLTNNFENSLDDMTDNGILELLSSNTGIKNNIYDSSNINDTINKINEINNKLNNKAVSIFRDKNLFIPKVVSKGKINDVKRKVVFYNKANQLMLDFMRSIGFDVEYMQSSTMNGIFDPTNSTKGENGLRTVIRVVEGERGEQAFAEEFGHFLIAGMRSNGFVKDLINGMTIDNIKEIFGDEFDAYNKEYEGNYERLANEAAGKLLARYINNNESNKERLLSKIWNNIKSLFNGHKESEIDDIIYKARKEFNNISKSIKRGDFKDIIRNITPNFESSVIEYKDSLKQINFIESITENAVDEALEIVGKMKDILYGDIAIESKKGTLGKGAYAGKMKKIYTAASIIENMKEGKLTGDEMYIQLAAVYSALSSEITNRANDILKKLEDFGNNSKYDNVADVVNDKEEMKRFSRIMNDLREFCNNYNYVVHNPSLFTDLLDEVSSQNKTEALNKKENLNKINSGLVGLHNKLSNIYRDNLLKLTISISKEYYDEDIDYGFERDKGDIDNGEDEKTFKTKRRTLMNIFTTAHDDITFVDRFLGSLGTAKNEILTICNAIYRKACNDRNIDIAMYQRKLDVIQKKFGSNDTSFMFKRDEDGNITKYIISEYDWLKYEKDLEDYKKHLDETLLDENGNLKKNEKRELIKKWYDAHSELIEYSNGTITKKFRVPNKLIYPSDDLNNLSKEQREYYDEVFAIKKEMHLILPGLQKLYYSPFCQKDGLDSIFDNDGLTRTAKNLYNEMLDEIRMTDQDEEYGIRDNIILDKDGNPVNQVPLRYIRPLKDLNRLSLDFTGNIAKFVAMAKNYEYISDASEKLELMKSQLAEVEFEQKDKFGNVIKNSVKDKNGNVIERKYTKKGSESEAYKRLQQFMDVNCYGKGKGKFNINILGKSLNITKMVSVLRNYITKLYLGLNFTNDVSNRINGHIQQWLSASGGEKYDYKDLLRARAEYVKLSFQYNKNRLCGIVNADDMLSLIINKLDPEESNYSDSKHDSSYRSAVKKAIKRADVMIGQKLGERNIRNTTALAILIGMKCEIEDENGNRTKSTIFDCLEKVINEDGTFDVTIRDNVYFDGKKISGEGITKEDINSFFSKQSLVVQEENHIVGGAMATEDRGVINFITLCDNLMHFRQWMVELYNHRFAGTYYDARTKKYKEGFYKTFVNTISRGYKANGISGIAEVMFKHGMLSEQEKQNVKKAEFEIAFSSILSLIIMLFLSVGRDDDDEDEEDEGISEDMNEDFLEDDEFEEDDKIYKRDTSLLYRLVNYRNLGRFGKSVVRFIDLEAKRIKTEINSMNPFSIPFGPWSMWQSVLTILKSPIPVTSGIDTVTKSISNIFNDDLIKDGIFKGLNKGTESAANLTPYGRQLIKLTTLTTRNGSFMPYE